MQTATQADVTSAGRLFQIREPIATEKARLARVDNLTVGTTRRLESVEKFDG